MTSYLFSLPVKLGVGVTVGAVLSVGLIGAVIEFFSPLGDVWINITSQFQYRIFQNYLKLMNDNYYYFYF